MSGNTDLVVAPKALRAFYGASDRLKANTAKAHIGAGKSRPQQIYTPKPIVDGLLRLWPEGIALDPCSGPESIVPAKLSWFGEQIATGRLNKDGEPILEWTGPGIVNPWRPRTYVNPTYVNLEEWLVDGALTHGILDAEGELAMLIPLRTVRGWFREYLKYTTRVCLLDPVTFQDYEQSFPAPLVMTYHGDRDLDAAFKGLGECCTLSF